MQFRIFCVKVFCNNSHHPFIIIISLPLRSNKAIRSKYIVNMISAIYDYAKETLIILL